MQVWGSDAARCLSEEKAATMDINFLNRVKSKVCNPSNI